VKFCKEMERVILVDWPVSIEDCFISANNLKLLKKRQTLGSVSVGIGTSLGVPVSCLSLANQEDVKICFFSARPCCNFHGEHYFLFFSFLLSFLSSLSPSISPSQAVVATVEQK
jgi:hypothetical protein